jgi:hypothetical protein
MEAVVILLKVNLKTLTQITDSSKTEKYAVRLLHNAYMY